MYRKMKEIINNKKVKQGILIAIDLVIVALCIWVSLFMRFRWGHIPYEYYSAAKQSMVLDMAVTVVVFWYFKLYHSVGRRPGSAAPHFCRSGSGRQIGRASCRERV